VLKKRTRVAVGIAGSFIALVAVVIALRLLKVIGFEVAMLMLVALLGLYLGFGVLIAVYRLLARLE